VVIQITIQIQKFLEKILICYQCDSYKDPRIKHISQEDLNSYSAFM